MGDGILISLSLRASPLLVTGRGGVYADYKVKDILTVGPSFFTFGSTMDVNLGLAGVKSGVRAFGIGARALLSLSSNVMSSGFVLNTGVHLMPTTLYASIGDIEASQFRMGFETEALFSYRWIHSSGVTIQAGAGVSFSGIPSEMKYETAQGTITASTPLFSSGWSPDFELTAGYTF